MKNTQSRVSMELPTHYGTFVFTVWPGERGRELVALSTLHLDPKKEVMIRIHSECLTGDIFASRTCDCGSQKERALRMIQEHGNGIFIYHRQEGRNIGLYKKVQAYNLMQTGLDTHEANIELVGHPDSRDYRDALSVLHELLDGHKSKIRLLTNNPYKKLYLAKHGYAVFGEPLLPTPTEHSASYIDTKEKKFLHGGRGNEPYVGITLYRTDLSLANDLKKILGPLHLGERGREVYFGIAIFPGMGDTKSLAFAEEICTFAKEFSSLPEVHIVLHTEYPESRGAYRDLKKFLARLDFPYGLQFRLPRSAQKIDIDILDALHAERTIFQLKSEQYHTLDSTDFREYFSRPHRFLLLDESFGTGVSEPLEKTKEKILFFVSRGLSRVGIAGGYSAETAGKLFELEDYFKLPISIDAETNVRTGGKFSLEKAEAYLRTLLTPAI